MVRAAQSRRSEWAPRVFRAVIALVLCARVVAGAQAPALLSNDTAIDDTGNGRAFVEIVSERDMVFVHERARVAVRAGIERGSREKELVQLFQRPLDVPVQIQLHWSREHAPALNVRLANALPGPTLALGEVIVGARELAPRTEDGRTFDVFELEFDVVADAPGEHELAPALLRFAYATQFDDDFVRGRVPKDRVDAYVTSLPFALHVAALPEAGRPADFGGAVGRFTARAESNVRAVELGGEIEVALHVAGDGDLSAFTPPRQDRLAGFQLRGVRDETRADERTFTYSFAVIERVSAFPALAFPYFDPAPPGRYASAKTEPIPLQVTGESPSRASEDEKHVSPIAVGAAAGLAIGAALAFAVWRRARARERAANTPERVRVRAAASVFRARIDEPGVDAGVALTEFLSAALASAPSAFVGHAAAERLASAGVPRELAERTATLLDELVSARFGGTLAPGANDAARAIVAELERALDTAVR